MAERGIDSAEFADDFDPVAVRRLLAESTLVTDGVPDFAELRG